MQTTLTEQKRNSNMQEMGETREPMAYDCWTDAQRLAEMYSKSLQRDFWVLYAAKPHVSIPNAIVAGWEISVTRPPAAMVGVLSFKWNNSEKRLTVDTDMSLPYDVPISSSEMSTSEKDFVPTIADAAKKSGSILLA
jgi:hypothetical protein